MLFFLKDKDNFFSAQVVFRAVDEKLPGMKSFKEYWEDSGINTPVPTGPTLADLEKPENERVKKVQDQVNRKRRCRLKPVVLAPKPQIIPGFHSCLKTIIIKWIFLFTKKFHQSRRIDCR